MAVTTETIHEGPAASASPVRLGVHGFAWTSLALLFAMATMLVISSLLAIKGFIPYWLATPFNTICFYCMGHINHEGFHSNISGTANKWKWIDATVSRIVSFFFWFSGPGFRAVHLAHHRHTNDAPMDADMWMARKHPLAIIAAAFTMQPHYEYKLWGMYKNGLVTRRLMIEFYIERALVIALAVTLFQLGYGTEAFFLWLLPAYFNLPLLAFFFAYAVHHPHHHEGKYRDSNVWLTNNRFLQPIVTAVFMFQNYHLIHHLHPRVPFYRYGVVFRQIRGDLERERAAIRTI